MTVIQHYTEAILISDERQSQDVKNIVKMSPY